MGASSHGAFKGGAVVACVCGQSGGGRICQHMDVVPATATDAAP